MVAAKVTAFGGMVPIMDDTLLPDMAAAHAENTWLYSGALIGLPTPQHVHTNGPHVQKIYRLPAQYTSPLQFEQSTWMEFEHPDTDVIRSPVFGDVWDRYYWASPAGPPRYNTRDRIEHGHDGYLLGVPAPLQPPVVEHEGGSSGIVVARAYVYTWVTRFGEEGPPSPPALVIDGDAGDLWTIKVDRPSSADRGTDRVIEKIRIYRTITSSAGIATYFFITEQPTSDLDYRDSKSDLDIVGNEQLQSTEWSGPPEDLQGFIMMPNGIAAGWRENELWFSEPYRLHAWPASYVQTVEYPIVGLGVASNQALIVCTRGFPVTAYGTTPLGIVTTKLTLFEPCTSRASILSTPEGVYYVSPDGLVLVADVAGNVTAKYISKDRWQQLIGKTPVRAARLGSAYYAWGSVIPDWVQTDAFQMDAFQGEDLEGAKHGFMLDPTDERVAFSVLSSDVPRYGVQNDVWNGEVLLLREDSVKRLNMGDASILTEPALWRSKKYQTYPATFGVFKVHFTVPPGTPAPPPARDTSLVQTLDDKWGLVRWFASYGNDDERHLTTHELRASGEQMRLPSDAKYEYFWFELETRVRVKDVKFATTAKELRGVP